MPIPSHALTSTPCSCDVHVRRLSRSAYVGAARRRHAASVERFLLRHRSASMAHESGRGNASRRRLDFTEARRTDPINQDPADGLDHVSCSRKRQPSGASVRSPLLTKSGLSLNAFSLSPGWCGAEVRTTTIGSAANIRLGCAGASTAWATTHVIQRRARDAARRLPVFHTRAR